MPMEIKTLKVTLEKLLAITTNAKYAHDLCDSNFTSRYVPVRRVGEYIYIYTHTHIYSSKYMYRYKDKQKSIIHSSPQTTSNLKVHQSRTNKLYYNLYLQLYYKSYNKIHCSNKNELILHAIVEVFHNQTGKEIQAQKS